MSTPPASIALFTARALVDELVRAGVRVVCVAPGSRSTSLALAVAERGELASHVLTDERSMGFFALGIARATSRPVALVCSSGTAAANLLPAVVEASLGGGGLVVMTADRPPELRDCAAPQTIDQATIFGSHTRWTGEVPMLDCSEGAARVLRSVASRAAALAADGKGGPVHLNVALREPFVDDSFPCERPLAAGARDDAAPFTGLLRGHGLAEDDVRNLAARLRGARRGVLVCAGQQLPAAAVAGLARALGWPVLADPMSGLRLGDHDRSHVVDAVEPLLRSEEFREDLRPDAVIRFGLTPAPRSLQRWLEEAWPAEHVVVSEAAWPDPVRSATSIVRADPGEFCRALIREIAPDTSAEPRPVQAWLDQWLALSAAARTSLEDSLGQDGPLLDGDVLRSLVRILPDDATLVVGNSMPVRDADAFVATSDRRLRVMANRGASGIDGVVSTALGIAASSDTPTALVLGDLSFLHDAAALAFAWARRIPLLIVVVNNDGGGIFHHLPLRRALARDGGQGSEIFERFFGTPHGADLAKVAALAGGFFARVEGGAELDAALMRGLESAAAGPAVVEVVSDRETARLRQVSIVEAAQAAARRVLVSRRDQDPSQDDALPNDSRRSA